MSLIPSVYYIPGPKLGLSLKAIILLPPSEPLLPVQSSFQKGGEEGCEKGKQASGCERQTPRSIPALPHCCLHGAQTLTSVTQAGVFSTNISLERITKVFSLVLLSCDQSIAQEMGSLESCLSKISYFTGWHILREHSAPSLPRANISVTCVLRARLRPHILCLGKENIRAVSFVLTSTAPTPISAQKC